MIAIKGTEEIPTDCKKCPLVGEDGNSKVRFRPMMCIPIWATTHEIKHCVEGKVLDDCPLVDIITCEDCRHRDPEDRRCDCGHDIIWQLPRGDKWYCADAKRRE